MTRRNIDGAREPHGITKGLPSALCKRKVQYYDRTIKETRASIDYLLRTRDPMFMQICKPLGVDTGQGVDLQGCSKGKNAPHRLSIISIKLLVPTNHHMPFQASHIRC